MASSNRQSKPDQTPAGLNPSTLRLSETGSDR